MKIRICVIFFTLLFGMDLSLFSQAIGKKELLDYVDRMRRVTLPSEGEAYRMIMETTTIPRNKGQKSMSISSESIITSEVIYFKTGMVSLYQDSINCIVVLHQAKKIYIRGAVKNGNQSQIDKMISIQQQLIDNSTVINNGLTTQDGHECSLFCLLPSYELAKTQKIDKIEMVYDHVDRILKKVIINYSLDSKIASQLFEYQDVNFDYKGKILSFPVLSYFFNKNGQLIGSYAGYQVIDERKKSNG